jgi:hypothetical protein
VLYFTLTNIGKQDLFKQVDGFCFRIPKTGVGRMPIFKTLGFPLEKLAYSSAVVENSAPTEHRS